jgi:hypothetical protein
MRPRRRLGLRAAITLEFGPDASEAGQGPIFIDREPDHVSWSKWFGSGAYALVIAKVCPPCRVVPVARMTTFNSSSFGIRMAARLYSGRLVSTYGGNQV